MYDDGTRWILAEELVDAFAEGSWRAEELAERAAGRLDRRPGWLDGLAWHMQALGRRAGPLGPEDRLRLARAVDDFLRAREAGRADERPPELVRLSPPAPRYATLRHEWPIASIPSVGALAERLELSDGQLAWLADVRGLERRVTREALRNYRYRWVPRRSGLPRLIEAPKLRLKEVQRWVLREILRHVAPHDAAHGFVRGRSALGHAAQHSRSPAVLSLDLRDFFASVTAARVFGIFRTLGYGRPVAHVLTGLTTNVSAQIAWDALPPLREGSPVDARFHLGRRLATPHLPQGAPSSPTLANLAAFGLDRRLSGLATVVDLRYSRYADDLTLSGAALTSGRRAADIARTVAAVARDEGFTLHPAKSRLRTAARRQQITGIVVNAHPNLPRDEYDRLRATLHRLACDGPRAPAAEPATRPAGFELRAHLHGRITWVEQLNPRRGAKLRRTFDAIDWR